MMFSNDLFCRYITIIRELRFPFHPCRVSVADGAHLTEFATKFPHFEGLHLQNTALFGEDTRVILYAYSCIFCFSWIFSVPFLFLDFLTVVC